MSKALDEQNHLRIVVPNSCVPSATSIGFCGGLKGSDDETLIVLRPNGSIDMLEMGGAPVGMFPDSSYEEGAVQLDPGNVVITYTDGVIEAANESGEEWGVQGLLNATAAWARQGTENAEHLVRSNLYFHGRLLQGVPDGRCDISSLAGALTLSNVQGLLIIIRAKKDGFRNEVRQRILSQITKEYPEGWLDVCRLA
jgi:Stage II sporulation protein E (SpoIIE)